MGEPTYNPPRSMMPQTPAFFRVDICSLKIEGIGKIKMKKSMKRLMTAMTTKNRPVFNGQCPSVLPENCVQ